MLKLGTYQGKEIIINTKEIKHGLISGISATRKERLISSIKDQVENCDGIIFHIDLEKHDIEKSLEIIKRMEHEINCLKKYNLEPKKNIFCFIENATYIFTSNETNEKYLAQKIEEFLQMANKNVDLHMIISTYPINHQYLPKRILNMFNFVILGFTPDIDESMYLLESDIAAKLTENITNGFIIKTRKETKRFNLKK